MAKKVKSKKMGRPFTYCDEVAQTFYRLMASGMSVIEAATHLKVTTKTIYKWKKTYPEFAELYDLAYEAGLSAELFLMRRGIKGQIRNYNGTAHDKLLSNMYKDEWNKSTPAPQQNIDNSTTIVNIGLESNANLSKIIRRDLAQLREVIDVDALFLEHKQHIEEKEEEENPNGSNTTDST